jgi:hypothetical protein
MSLGFVTVGATPISLVPAGHTTAVMKLAGVRKRIAIELFTVIFVRLVDEPTQAIGIDRI